MKKYEDEDEKMGKMSTVLELWCAKVLFNTNFKNNTKLRNNTKMKRDK